MIYKLNEISEFNITINSYQNGFLLALVDGWIKERQDIEIISNDIYNLQNILLYNLQSDYIKEKELNERSGQKV